MRLNAVIIACASPVLVSFVYKLIDRFRYIVNVCIDIVQRIDSDNSDLCTPMTELPYLHARAFKYFSPRPV